MYTFKASLKSFNTLGLNIKARQVIFAHKLEILLDVWNKCQNTNQSFILLGKGSNVLFMEDFNGIVVINCIKGIKINEQKKYWLLHVNAGENWHQLVKFTLQNNMHGLENLAFIPGLVGSAPIQNIGAYGLEFKDICEYVDLLNLRNKRIQRLYNHECFFEYRDSIFKHHYSHGYAVLSIGLKLQKKWKPILTYGELINLNNKIITPWSIFNLICKIRKTTLPNPYIKGKGNVGSFFKNPIIDISRIHSLLSTWPILPYYLYNSSKVKLSANWLIDQCNLKGYKVGGAAIYNQKSIVLVNKKQATPQDIIKLAHDIRKKVGNKFNIWLEPEVCFISSTGICNGVKIIS